MCQEKKLFILGGMNSITLEPVLTTEVRPARQTELPARSLCTVSAGLPRGDWELAGPQTNTRHGRQEHLHQPGGLRVHQLQGGHSLQCGGGGHRSGLDPT